MGSSHGRRISHIPHVQGPCGEAPFAADLDLAGLPVDRGLTVRSRRTSYCCAMDVILAAAAAVQAVSAVIIVVLTRRLSQTAKNALSASDRQAGAAAELIQEMRVDRHLTALPVLNIYLDAISLDGDRPETTLYITNTSQHPAMNVRVGLAEAWDVGQAQEARIVTPTAVAIIGPGEVVEVPVDLSRFPRGQGARVLHTNWVLIDIHYQGLLGARLEQEWYWEPFEWGGRSEPAPGHGQKLLLYRLSGRSGAPAEQNDIGWMRG